MRKASVDRPQDPRALYTLAVCAQHLGRMDEARTRYRQVLQRFSGSEAELYARAALVAIDPAFAKEPRLPAATKAGELLGPPLKKPHSEFDVPYKAENGHFKVTALVDGQTVEMYFQGDANEHIFSSDQIRQIDPQYLNNLTAGASTPVDSHNSNNLSVVVTHQIKIKRIKFGKIDALNTTAKIMDSVNRYGYTYKTSDRPILAGIELLKGWRWNVIQNRRLLHFVKI